MPGCPHGTAENLTMPHCIITHACLYAGTPPGVLTGSQGISVWHQPKTVQLHLISIMQAGKVPYFINPAALQVPLVLFHLLLDSLFVIPFFLLRQNNLS